MCSSSSHGHMINGGIHSCLVCVTKNERGHHEAVSTMDELVLFSLKECTSIRNQ